MDGQAVDVRVIVTEPVVVFERARLFVKKGLAVPVRLLVVDFVTRGEAVDVRLAVPVLVLVCVRTAVRVCPDVTEGAFVAAADADCFTVRVDVLDAVADSVGMIFCWIKWRSAAASNATTPKPTLSVSAAIVPNKDNKIKRRDLFIFLS